MVWTLLGFGALIAGIIIFMLYFNMNGIGD